MLKVFKYEMPLNDYFDLDLPRGAKILKVDTQFDLPQLWALVDPDESIMEMRKFRFAGTGHPIVEELEKLEFIDTFQMRDGNLIFHVFEVFE